MPNLDTQIGASSKSGDTLDRADRLRAYRHPTALCDGKATPSEYRQYESSPFHCR